MKNKIIISCLCAMSFLTSCSSSITWNNIKEDVTLLQKNGFVLYFDDTEASIKEANDLFQTDLIDSGLDFLITNVYGLYEEDNELNTITFVKFDDKNDANYVYDLFTNRLSSTSGVKHYIFNDILVTSNSNDAIDILGY